MIGEQILVKAVAGDRFEVTAEEKVVQGTARPPGWEGGPGYFTTEYRLLEQPQFGRVSNIEIPGEYGGSVGLVDDLGDVADLWLSNGSLQCQVRDEQAQSLSLQIYLRLAQKTRLTASGQDMILAGASRKPGAQAIALIYAATDYQCRKENAVIEAAQFGQQGNLIHAAGTPGTALHLA